VKETMIKQDFPVCPSVLSGLIQRGRWGYRDDYNEEGGQ
jgi:hypothetical protein